MSKARKRRSRPRAHIGQAEGPRSGLKQVIEALHEHSEALLMGLGVVHLLLFLVVLTSAGMMRNPYPPDMTFGADLSSEVEVQAEIAKEKTHVIPPVGTFLLSLYTAGLWVFLFLSRGSLAPRVRRFCIMFFLPGTLTTFYALVEYFAK